MQSCQNTFQGSVDTWHPRAVHTLKHCFTFPPHALHYTEEQPRLDADRVPKHSSYKEPFAHSENEVTSGRWKCMQWPHFKNGLKMIYDDVIYGQTPLTM